MSRRVYDFDRQEKFDRQVFMKTMKPFCEPGQQLLWKITFTLLCVLVGAALTLFVFRIF
jgi:hypothetical protein